MTAASASYDNNLNAWEVVPLAILLTRSSRNAHLSVYSCLRLRNCSIIVTYSNRVTLGRIFSCRPRLVVASVNVPRLSNCTLVRGIHRRPTFQLLPIVFLATRGRVRSQVQNCRIKYSTCLPGPFSLRRVNTVIHGLLRQSRLVRST